MKWIFIDAVSPGLIQAIMESDESDGGSIIQATDVAALSAHIGVAVTPTDIVEGVWISLETGSRDFEKEDEVRQTNSRLLDRARRDYL